MHKGLELKNISKIYQDDNGETLAIKDFSYKFENGEFVTLLGPSRLWEINIAFNHSWT